MSATQMDIPIIAEQLPVKQDAFMQLIDQSVKGGADADVVGKMLDHWERYQKMQAKQAFDTAMLNFKNSVPQVVKNRLADMNGKYSYTFADIEEVCDKLEPAMTANGFDKRWTTEPNERGIVMSCIIKHIGGHYETTTLPPAPNDNSGGKNPVQAIGSTLSYLQRYSLLMAFGIAPRNADTDAHPAKPSGMDGLDDWCTAIADSGDFDEMDKHFRKAYSIASDAKDQQAKKSLENARQEWRDRRKGAR